jgi:antitoxin (DNA-binding transcriptional repressor) of toxin-antitoxin stability system
MCHIIVSRMKTTTIRELKHATSTVLSWVAAGETVEVRRRRNPVALLMPLRRKSSVARPDFTARLRAIYGAVQLPTTATELVAEARGER